MALSQDFSLFFLSPLPKKIPRKGGSSNVTSFLEPSCTIQGLVHDTVTAANALMQGARAQLPTKPVPEPSLSDSEPQPLRPLPATDFPACSSDLHPLLATHHRRRLQRHRHTPTTSHRSHRRCLCRCLCQNHQPQFSPPPIATLATTATAASIAPQSAQGHHVHHLPKPSSPAALANDQIVPLCHAIPPPFASPLSKTSPRNLDSCSRQLRLSSPRPIAFFTTRLCVVVSAAAQPSPFPRLLTNTRPLHRPLIRPP